MIGAILLSTSLYAIVWIGVVRLANKIEMPYAEKMRRMPKAGKSIIK